MKNTSRTMFNIGNIVNICYIGLGALLALLGTILIIVGAVSDDPALVSSAVSCLIWGIYLLVAAILCFVFVGKAKKELADESNRDNKPFIITIVFGAISGNPFYILAGIFGLIAESKQGNQPKEEPAPAEEKPAEEPKEE